jgi:hypothetical protein
MVELASEDARVEAGVIAWMKNIMEETTCKHQGKECTRRRSGRIIFERVNGDVF